MSLCIKTSLLILMATCLMFSCSGEKESKSEKETPSLVSWSNEFLIVHEDEDWAYYEDHENFISEYFSVDYQENLIIATTLIEVNCIDSIAGKIEVSNDTIFLKSEIIMTDDRLCSEFHKFEFIISNPSNIRYKVISMK